MVARWGGERGLVHEHQWETSKVVTSNVIPFDMSLAEDSHFECPLTI